MLRNIKHFIKNFEWMKVYFSPFKPPVPKIYIGKIAVGTPCFFPKRWVGFDFTPLYWKTKWADTDYRFEWSPVWSFVFFGYQIAITFVPIEHAHFWECWLYYSRETKGTVKERLEQSRKEFPCIWTRYYQGVKEEINYWDLILKNKYLK
jgi:hypothetical protein